MKFNKIFLILTTLALIFVLSACSKSESTKDKTSNKVNTSTSTTSKETDTKGDSVATPSSSAGVYVDYSPELITNSTANDKIILFFHASWCPTCKAIEKDIKANLDDIPENFKILKVDYDNSDDLIDKYGVRTQYTMVQVDKDGNKLGLWNDSFTLQDIVDSST